MLLIFLSLKTSYVALKIRLLTYFRHAYKSHIMCWVEYDIDIRIRLKFLPEFCNDTFYRNQSGWRKYDNSHSKVWLSIYIGAFNLTANMVYDWNLSPILVWILFDLWIAKYPINHSHCTPIYIVYIFIYLLNNQAASQCNWDLLLGNNLFLQSKQDSSRSI